jgi:hypothetical protein
MRLPTTTQEAEYIQLHAQQIDQRLMRVRSLLSPPWLSSLRLLGGGGRESALSLLLEGLDDSAFGDFGEEIRLFDPCLLGGSSTAVPAARITKF